MYCARFRPGSGQLVIGDIAAESVAVIARGRRGRGERLVDLFANFFADRRGGIEVGVVAAGVERDGEIEERLTGLEGDGGSAGLGLCDAWRGPTGWRFSRVESGEGALEELEEPEGC